MTRRYINDDWKFYENDQSYEIVRIPHTCKEVPFHYFDESLYQMECRYEKEIYIEKELEDKKILITFEGVGHSYIVYCNEKEVGRHNCGYSACTFDLTDAILFGDNNIITVYVNSKENQNIPPFGFVIDYMTFGGIYRDVYIDIKNQTYIEDVYYQTNQNKLHVEVSLSLHIDNYNIHKKLILDHQVITLDDTHHLISNDTLEDIKYWDIDHPVLYKLIVELEVENQIVDTYEVSVGFRDIEFKKDGFYLNNKKIKIKGLNRHQSYPYVGYAMSESMQRYDVHILKNELGCNAVRTSHYPQSQDFIDECDKQGLLVFTEMPGWQHIGDEDWKKQALKNVEDMVKQYRNHPSIIIWGVRINESQDDHDFYTSSNQIAHQLDNRATGGVRAHARSELLEDVYTYNDFVHCGNNQGCSKKKDITSDNEKAYLVTEYNGHMYPTKTYDCEEHRVEHFLRHCRVLEDISKEIDIAGSFGWCMADYNTHKDFGSGDRICYHGVTDMFRNPKLASLAYALNSKQDILELTSSMDIGEHPGCNRGPTYILTNLDSVKMYKNDIFIKEYHKDDSLFKHVGGVILIDDFIGNQIIEKENFKPRQANIIKNALNHVAVHGYNKLPMKVILSMIELIIRYHMNPNDAVAYYNKYIGDWGGQSTTYKFIGIKDGKEVKTLIKEPATKVELTFDVSHHHLVETKSYDVASIRIHAVDQNNNILPFYQDALTLEVEGDIELIGPSVISMQGGMFGTYVKSVGKTGSGKLKIKDQYNHEYQIEFDIQKGEQYGR